MSEWPQMRTFEQTAPQPSVPDVAQAARDALKALDISSRIRPGRTVAVGVGSRGISDLPVVVGQVIEALRESGARPFIVPAMGSHGGATAEGQARLLGRLGVSEAAFGCPVRAGMETEAIGRTEDGFPIHFGREALAADHVVPVNRLKFHPRFMGAYESGLMKMLLVGLGKKEGASAVHRHCRRGSFAQLVRSAGQRILDRVSVPFGMAIIENAFHRIARLQAVPGGDMLEVEPRLLEEAKRLAPRLPVAEADLLVVDRIGKDVSGTGMDTYVIGLRPDSPTRVGRIVVLDLTEATAGNAHGIGFADFTTRRVWDKFDREATYANAVTAGRPEGARLPIPLGSDRDAVRAGVDVAGGPEARIVHIRDTAELRRFEASEALWDELAGSAHVRAVGPPHEFAFDAEGRLRPAGDAGFGA